MQAASLPDGTSDLGPSAIAAAVAVIYVPARSVPVPVPPTVPPPPARADFLAAGGAFPSDDAPGMLYA